MNSIVRCGLFTLLLIGLLTGCEAPIGENYIEIEKAPEEIPLSIDLNVLTNGEAILINKNTTIGYSLSAFGRDISGIRLTLGDKVWEYGELSNNGTISIREDEFPSGTYTLTCDLFVPSGTGSIADHLEMEGYQGHMEWPVIIDYTMELPDKLNWKKNEDGYFELSWMTPSFSHLKLVSYTLYKTLNDNQIVVKIPAGETSYVDKMQVGGKGVYMMRMNLFYDENTTMVWYMDEIEVENPIEVNAIGSDLDFVEVIFKLPFTCYATYHIDEGEPVLLKPGETSIKIPVTKFGSSAWWDLTEVRLSLASPDKPEEKLYNRTLTVGSPGVYLPDERLVSWAYNPVTNLLYAKGYTDLNSYSASTIEHQKAYSSLNNFYHGEVHSSFVSDKIAVKVSNAIKIFNGNTLEHVHTIPVSGFNRMVGTTRDDKILYAVYDENGYDCTIHVCEWDGTPVAQIPAGGSQFDISTDGKYLLYSYYTDLYLLTLDNYNVVKKTILPVEYGYHDRCWLNPGMPDQIIVWKENEETEVRRCADFSLMWKAASVNQFLRGGDPLTGNLLIEESGYAKVVSPLTGETLFSIKIASNISPCLIGNVLISSDGYLLNIEKYLKK